MEMEQAIDCFAIYGGVDSLLSLDLFEALELSVERHFVQHFLETEKYITPSYLMDTPYQEMLTAIARGDGRLSNVFRRARIGEELGKSIINDLVKHEILSLEISRQAPLKVHPKQLLPKHLRNYRIEPKIRFVKPFFRFWFGFVESYRGELLQNNGIEFNKNFQQHKERAYSLLFEQLSNLLLKQHISKTDPILSQGSFWDHHSEFDLLSFTKSGKVILGECKYASRKVTRKELGKLKDKAMQSGLKVDIYAIFSKSGFSNELHRLKDDSLLLFELEDFRSLL